MGSNDEIEALRASRARVVLTAIDDRRRTERALHDGVQQELIATAVRLQLLRQLVSETDPTITGLINEIRDDLHEALRSAREHANEIYPSLLDANGLAEALRSPPLEAAVSSSDVTRLPREVEAVAYLCCRAVAEHTVPGETPVIRLIEQDGALRIEVDGGEPTDAARDLVEALGGELFVEPGYVTALLPLDGYSSGEPR